MAYAAPLRLQFMYSLKELTGAFMLGLAVGMLAMFLGLVIAFNL